MRLFIKACLGVVAVLIVAFVGLLAMGTREREVPLVTPGYHVTSLHVPHRENAFPVHVWYPTNDTNPPELHGQNLLFYGFHSQTDATPVPETRPLVVLIHGSGGNGPRLGWLATSLANAGFVVMAANHPGTTSQDSWPAETIKIWERPQDISAMLDWILADKPLGLSVDADRMGVLGFSIGGHSAMALGGALVTKAGFLNYCATSEDAVDCQWMERGGLDLNSINEEHYNAGFADPRLNSVVAVDPALPAATVQESLKAITVPVQLINLGARADLSDAVNVSAWESIIANVGYTAIPNSWHFSFLAECSLAGRIIIGVAARKTEEICTDPQNGPRGEIHDQLRDIIVPFFQSTLGDDL